ncbi:MAG: hypothetical protein ACOX7K_03385 [Oscillospiraceae bacterium]|jgi:protein arginine kinase activator
MKCEKCNKNEAILHYTMNINGEFSERHLCADCAREEGFGEMFHDNLFGFGDSLFDRSFGYNRMGRSLFDSFFGGSMFPSFGRSLMAPSIAFPRIQVTLDNHRQNTTAPERAAVSADEKIPQDAGNEIRQKRELNALRHQLEQAIRAEEFEKCIELRQKIQELEQNH